MKEVKPPQPAPDKRQPNPPQKTVMRQPDKMVRSPGYQTK
jgi:hypothetical protein